MLVVRDTGQRDIGSTSEKEELNHGKKKTGEEWTEETSLQVERGEPGGVEAKSRVAGVEGQLSFVDHLCVRTGTLELGNVLVRVSAGVVADVRTAHVHKVGALTTDGILGNVDHQLVEANADEEITDETVQTDDEPVNGVVANLELHRLCETQD